MKKVLAELDVGPVVTKLSEVIKTKNYLAFADDFEVTELYSLLTELYTSSNKAKMKSIVTSSIIKFIYHTNKIEGSGLSSEKDTLSFLSSLREGCTTGEKEVESTYTLIKTEYNDSDKLSDHLIDEIKLKKWHTILSGTNLLPDPGNFRIIGVRTDNDGVEHLYPHHSVIEINIRNLCALIHQLAKEIDYNYSNILNKIKYTIALAVFAQFYFVDIHPFEDGNGRIGRFLSKYILDTILPFPFPMFIDRDNYLSAVRQDNPKELMSVFINDSTDYYRKIIKEHLQLPYEKLIVATSDTDLIGKISDLELKFQKRIMRSFYQTDVDSSFDISVNDAVYRIVKLSLIDIDDL